MSGSIDDGVYAKDNNTGKHELICNNCLEKDNWESLGFTAEPLNADRKPKCFDCGKRFYYHKNHGLWKTSKP